MQKQTTKKPSKANKTALISAILFLIYGLFIFAMGAMVRISGMLGCDELVSFMGCPLQDLSNGFSGLFVGVFVLILALLLGITIPIVWTLANVVVIFAGWRQPENRKSLIIISLLLNGLAVMLCLFGIVVMLLKIQS